MSLNSLIESLREITKKKVIKEGDENNSSYTDSTADQPGDIKSVVSDICHQWDTYKLDPSFPDNIKGKLDGAIGTTNPGNGDASKIATDSLKTDQATQKKEMGGDVQAVKDQDKFVPKVDTKDGITKVGEAKVIGKQTDQTKKAVATSNKTGEKDSAQVKKDLAGDKKDLKDIKKETTPVVGKSKVK